MLVSNKKGPNYNKQGMIVVDTKLSDALLDTENNKVAGEISIRKSTLDWNCYLTDNGKFVGQKIKCILIEKAKVATIWANGCVPTWI